MIDYNNNESSMVMDCDGYDCGKSLKMYGDFVECIQEAKDNGWKVMNNEGDWYHFCPRCWANKGAEGVFK